MKEKRIILHKIRRKANCFAHILPMELPSKTRTEGKIEGTGRRERKRKQLMDDLKNTRKYRKLKEEALDGTLENSLWTCR
jgi:hypothetical protein